MHPMPFVVLLLAAGCPAYVTGLIVAVVVDSVQRQTKWTRAKLREKLLEGREQEFDSSTTPIRETWFIRVGAALLCILIGSILWSSSFDARLSVVLYGMPTTLYEPFTQPTRSHLRKGSTITKAKPYYL